MCNNTTNIFMNISSLYTNDSFSYSSGWWFVLHFMYLMYILYTKSCKMTVLSDIPFILWLEPDKKRDTPYVRS